MEGNVKYKCKIMSHRLDKVGENNVKYTYSEPRRNET